MIVINWFVACLLSVMLLATLATCGVARCAAQETNRGGRGLVTEESSTTPVAGTDYSKSIQPLLVAE